MASAAIHDRKENIQSTVTRKNLSLLFINVLLVDLKSIAARASKCTRGGACFAAADCGQAREPHLTSHSFASSL
jgi:hypothetical protein